MSEKAVLQRTEDYEQLYAYTLKGHSQILLRRSWKNGTYWQLIFKTDSESLISTKKSFCTLRDARVFLSSPENISWCYGEIEKVHKMGEIANRTSAD